MELVLTLVQVSIVITRHFKPSGISHFVDVHFPSMISSPSLTSQPSRMGRIASLCGVPPLSLAAPNRVSGKGWGEGDVDVEAKRADENPNGDPFWRGIGNVS